MSTGYSIFVPNVLFVGFKWFVVAIRFYFLLVLCSRNVLRCSRCVQRESAVTQDTLLQTAIPV
jgi:hypothetical protein